MTTNEQQRHFRSAIRQAVKSALNDGLSGGVIVRLLASELDRLEEGVPALSPRQIASITASVAGRYGE